MKVVLTGASGFIGRALVRSLLADGHSFHALGRHRGGLPERVGFSHWDSLNGEPPMEDLLGADAVVHLAGEPVAQRWTAEAKRRIDESRKFGTGNLVSALGKLDRRPEVLVSASAIGYYGSRGEEILTESSAPGTDFLAKVCVDWEAAAESASSLGIRVVRLRTGIVLGAGGGALRQMLPPFRLGVGGPLGAGQQWMSWIHLEDYVRLIRFALEQRTATGALNAVAPHPVRNADFSRTLGRVLNRPAFLHVPTLPLKLLYGEMAQVLFASQRVLPERTLASGFTHLHTDLYRTLQAAI